MAFVVYRADGKVSSFALTQDIADARADADAALTAHMGDVAIPRELGPLNSWFDATNATLTNVPPVDNSPLAQLKRAALEGRRQFWGVWHAGLAQVSPGYSARVHALGADCLLGGWKAVYLTTIDAAVSVPLRVSKIAVASQGAQFITSPATFYQLAGRLTLPVNFGFGDPLDWVILNTAGDAYERRTLQAAIDAQQTDHPAADVPSFDAVDLLGTDWIEALAA